MSTRISSLAGVAALALLVAACGGSSSAAPSTGATAAPPTSEATMPAETSPAATEAATAAPTTEGTVPDITTGTAALANLESYRMTITMAMKGLQESLFSAFGDGLTLDATIVTTPVKAADLTMSMGTAGQTMDIGYRLIGDKAWINLGGDSWMETSAEDAGSTVDSFAPDQMLRGFSNLSGMSAVGDEEKNGVATTHYTASGSELAGALNDQIGLVDGTWTVDYWVAKDGGYPVAYVVEGKGANDASFSMSLAISDINSPSNTIETPTTGG